MDYSELHHKEKEENLKDKKEGIPFTPKQKENPRQTEFPSAPQGHKTPFTTRQKEIIDVSIELISQGGIQELTIKNISHKMGISEPAIYRHFESKGDILMAILEYFKMSTHFISEKVLSENTSPLNKINRFFEMRIEEFSQTPALARVMFSEEIFQNDKCLSHKVFEVMKAHQKIIFEVLKQGQEMGEIRRDISIHHIAMILMGSFRLLITRWRLSEFGFDLRKEGEELWQSLKKIVQGAE